MKYDWQNTYITEPTETGWYITWGWADNSDDGWYAVSYWNHEWKENPVVLWWTKVFTTEDAATAAFDDVPDVGV